MDLRKYDLKKATAKTLVILFKALFLLTCIIKKHLTSRAFLERAHLAKANNNNILTLNIVLVTGMTNVPFHYFNKSY